MTDEGWGPIQASTLPFGRPGVAMWIHTGGGLQHNAVHGGWQLRSMLGNEQESSVRKSPGVLGKASIPAVTLLVNPAI